LTLEKMAQGGLWDHLGGGFHRYSTDRYWEVPHFEKMLYDNAQLLSIYARSAELAQNPNFKQIARSTADFVLREMTSPDGAFYSAMDAETDEEEGKYYRWERSEIEQLLPADDFPLFAKIYGLDQPPNLENKYYVLRLKKSIGEWAAELSLEADALERRLAASRAKLLEARRQRPRPLVDTKVLAGWNGLMIRGLADAGRMLHEPAYTQAAERAAAFVLRNLRNSQGRLLRSWNEGQASQSAYLDDYALIIDGLLALHQATDNPQW